MKPTIDTMKPDVVSSKHPPPGTLGTLLQDLAENTAMHGLPHVQRANSKYRKIFWVVVLMLGTGMLVWQIEKMVRKYLSHPVDTKVTMEFSKTMTFPAVTFCNLNPVKQSRLTEEEKVSMEIFSPAYTDDHTCNETTNEFPDSTQTRRRRSAPDLGIVDPLSDVPVDDLEDDIVDDIADDLVEDLVDDLGDAIPPVPDGLDLPDYDYGQDNPDGLPDDYIPPGDLDGDSRLDDMDDYLDDSPYDQLPPGGQSDGSRTTPVPMNPYTDHSYVDQEDLDPEYKAETTALDTIVSMDDTSRANSAYSLEDMLLSCTYRGKECNNTSDFSYYFSGRYGNCFTFNAVDSIDVKQSSRPGPLYGLTMEIFIDQDEYVPLIADTAGIRVDIHDQEATPLPYDKGISVEPGTATAVSLIRKKHRRSEPPYGVCQSYTKLDAQDSNPYIDKLPHLGYSLEVCRQTCYQKKVIEECMCADSAFLFDGKPFEPYLDNITVCQSTSNSQYICMEIVKAHYEDGTLDCAHCKQNCSETIFEYSVSSGMWPSTSAEDQVLNSFSNMSNDIQTKLCKLSDAERLHYLSKNVLKLEVYYSTLDTEVISTLPSYQSEDLLSDLGGQVGLWLGFSVITVFEFVELIGDVIKLCCRKPARNKTIPTVDVSSELQS